MTRYIYENFNDIDFLDGEGYIVFPNTTVYKEGDAKNNSIRLYKFYEKYDWKPLHFNEEIKKSVPGFVGAWEGQITFDLNDENGEITVISWERW